MTLKPGDPLAGQLIGAIRAGDIDALQRVLAAHPGLAAAEIQDARGAKTPLHVVTDWPGFFPNGPAVVKALVLAGADPNARTQGGKFLETPLQWAASSDDVEVAEALIEARADIEAGGASIAGGTALDNAIGYGCWRVARLLLSRGARVEKLWHAAALGLTSRVDKFFQEQPAPTTRELNDAFWQACHGGYRRMAESLLARGADLNWRPDYANQTPLEIAVAGGMDTGRGALINWLRDKGAEGATK